jgi:2-oxoglutaroyl-CoA hydrolase
VVGDDEYEAHRGMLMTAVIRLNQALLTDLDGFRVEISEADSRADIIFDRPPFNLMSFVQRDQLCAVFDALDGDSTVRVVVLRSEGEHFSGGGDLDGLVDAPSEHPAHCAWQLNAPSRCSKPVIAANRGYCFGAGFELSLACDFRIVTETTLYALPTQKLGQVAGSRGTARLQTLVGAARARDIVMRSRRISGPQAHDWGIATEFAVDSDLESMTDALVRELLAYSPLLQQAAKRQLNEIDEGALSVAAEREGHSFGTLRRPDDHLEGIRMFSRKPRIVFKGS